MKVTNQPQTLALLPHSLALNVYENGWVPGPGWTFGEQKYILSSLENEPRIVQLTAWSLYQLCYPSSQHLCNVNRWRLKVRKRYKTHFGMKTFNVSEK
jgi:hypothetical protein